jgi:hypothetical protein
MTRLEALRGLYDAVKAGTFPDASIGVGGGGKRPTINGVDADFFDAARDAYKGSVDAALALFASTLPGWIWNIVENSATVWPGFPNDPWPAFDEYSDKGPATALLLACIAALIAIEEGKG